MKKIIYIISGLFLIMSSCQDVLDKEPLGLISDAQVWQDENLVNSYLNDIYLRIQFLNRTGQAGFNVGIVGAMGAEFRTIGPWQEPYKASTGIIDETGASVNLRYWKYNVIRAANEMILQLETVSKLDQDFINSKLAEVRFLRAYIYFEMVKRYGGVPIITVPQSIDAPADELYVKRNSEQEVYDFITSEMDAILTVLPDRAVEGRPSKWAALALISRAALYAGSIGEFGTIQLEGLLGISNPQTYWEKSYNTSKSIINESGYSLYDKHADKAKNFQELFIEENNSEVIFSEVFDEGLQRTHSFSNLTMPDGFAAGWGSNFNVFYDMVELFDFADGSTGKMDRSLITSQEWASADLFGARDPRFIASVMYPETAWQGAKVYFHSATKNIGSAPEGWPAKAPNRNKNRVGFHLRKRLDEGTLLPTTNTDDTDYIVFRLGEIYLNFAEAAFNLGNNGEALDAVNIIRSRAGMPLLSEITQDVIRHERQVELFAEDHRYWDLRRWRIAQEVIDGIDLQGLKYTYNGETGKYAIKFVKGESSTRVFQERHYYLPLGLSIISDNPNLVENPGY